METERSGRKSDTDSLRRAVIFDLDGTLCKLNRHWSDYHLLGTDDPIAATTTLCRWARKDGELVIMLTGRPEYWRADTMKWLKEYGIHYDILIMRDASDRRSNEGYKRDVYERQIAPYFRVLFVAEDNPKSVRMFRELGLSVFDLGSSH